MNTIMKWTAMFFLAISTLFADFDATIPVLDIEEYQNLETQDQFVQKLREALKEVGFFALVNTGVDIEVLDQAYQACEDFFAKPLEEKMHVHDSFTNGQRGYVPGETAKGQDIIDYKEFYHIGKDHQNLLENIWPDDLSFKESLSALFIALEEHGHVLGEAIAKAIGVESTFFHEMTKDGDTLLRAIHYPTNPPKNQYWAAAHTDINLFTILPRATAEGLQLLSKKGKWIDVKVPENAFIINAGDMLENLTNGEFRSGKHRVVAKGDNYERFSIVYFVHVGYNQNVGPLPQCIERTGGQVKYAKATCLELLEERLVDLGLASLPMMCHLADSGLMERLIEVGRASFDAMKKLREMDLASEAVLQELEKIENS